MPNNYTQLDLSPGLYCQEEAQRAGLQPTSYCKGEEMNSEIGAEEEGGTLIGVRQELRHAVPEPLEGFVSPPGLEDDDCEVELQAEAPEDLSLIHI